MPPATSDLSGLLSTPDGRTARGDIVRREQSAAGRLITEHLAWGWWLTVGLLLLGGAAVALSLWVRPLPRTVVAAADRLAAGLTVAFLLAPAGRFGYLALPVLLVLWAWWADADAGKGASRSRVVSRVVSRGVEGQAGRNAVARTVVPQRAKLPPSSGASWSSPPATPTTEVRRHPDVGDDHVGPFLRHRPPE